MTFSVIEDFKLKGDQRKVVDSISKSLKSGEKFQTIKGATGTGKTYVMAKILEKVNSPAIVLAHNKTLAAQLYREFKYFFPNNAVEYFVSYYDYYQPEAYLAKRDLYIEKESTINEEIDRMRLKATSSLIERKDVIVVSSVSCIYGLGSPEDYQNMYLTFKVGERISRRKIIKSLIDIQYNRKDDILERGFFRVRGDIIDIFPSYLQNAFRIELFGDEIENLGEIDVMNNLPITKKRVLSIFPAKHFVMSHNKIEKALKSIREELNEQIKFFERHNKILERERIYNRTLYDLELLKTVGFCSGIENYSRHLSGRKVGEKPYTLFDYFPDNMVVFVDESHVTLPQVRGMFNGDRARKESLVEYGFRLPSALDNRPLIFDEFLKASRQFVFVSATPSEYEIKISNNFAELINRPTGLLDPLIEVRISKGQIDDLIFEIKKEVKKNNCILVTTLTKKMSEDLTTFLKEHQIKVAYLHSDIETIERVEIIKSLREKKINVIIGINLLREGLDIPEVSLVAILDADKIGFLRSKTALIQTSGRAARNVNGRVIMYADKISEAMKGCIEESECRRAIQLEFNKKNGIVPKSIKKTINTILERENTKLTLTKAVTNDFKRDIIKDFKGKSKRDIKDSLKKLDLEMKLAADQMNFELAIKLRDSINELKLLHNIKSL